MHPFRSTITTGIVFLALLGAYAAGVWFLWTEYTKNQEAKIVSQQQAANIQEQVELTNLAHSVASSSSRLAGFVISKDGDVDTINFLEKLAKERKLSFSVASVNEKEGNPFNSLSLQLVVDGSWEEIMQYVHLLEVFPQAVTFNSITLTKSAVAPGKVSRWRGAFEIAMAKQK